MCNIQCSALWGVEVVHTRVLVVAANGSSVGLDTEGKAALDFTARWTSETEADALSSVRANLQEQVKVIPHLRQCRIGNVNAKDPLPPAFIWHL